MQLRELHKIPVLNVLWQFTTRRIDLKGMTGFACTQHDNRKFGSSGIAQDHALLAQGMIETDRKSAAAIFLLNHPRAVPVFMPNVMRKPIHSAIIHLNALILNKRSFALKAGAGA